MDRWAGVPCADGPRRRARAAVVPTPRPASDDAGRLALMARYMDDAIVSYGPDGRIDWVNDAFVRLTGYDAQEAVGARRTDLIHGPFTRTPEFARLEADLARSGTPSWSSSPGRRPAPPTGWP